MSVETGKVKLVRKPAFRKPMKRKRKGALPDAEGATKPTAAKLEKQRTLEKQLEIEKDKVQIAIGIFKSFVSSPHKRREDIILESQKAIMRLNSYTK